MVRGASRYVVELAVLGTILASLGCQGTEFRPSRSIADGRDLRNDLLDQVDAAERKYKEARQEIDKTMTQVADLEKQLDGTKDIESLLQQRIDNLLRENQQLHQELTAIVMNGASDTDPLNFSLQNVSNTTRLGVTIPKSTERSLATLADHNAGVEFSVDEGVIRIASAELFAQGDELRPSSKSLLRELAKILNAEDVKPFNFLVVAHAPPSASVPKELVPYHPTVWHLTAHQSIAVEQFLEEAGLASTRVGIVSYAGQQPLVAGTDETSRRTNSRVEIYFTPPDPAR